MTKLTLVTTCFILLRPTTPYVTMMRDERIEDKPPYSRVFAVCDKQLRHDEIRSIFESYGDIENIRMPKDRNTGDSKGIAYVKFSKTSSAAAAIEALHMKYMQTNHKPLKVMVATTKNEERSENSNKYKRLFIKVPKESTESDIRDYFSKFGLVEHVHVQKDRETNESRGFAYVHYNTFSETARAFEDSDKKYKTVFATPKEELKRTRNNLDSNDRCPEWEQLVVPSSSVKEHRNYIGNNHKERNSRETMVKNEHILPLIKTKTGDFDTVHVSCSPFVAQKPIEKLFDIIPGMTQFKFTSNSIHDEVSTAIVKYDSQVAASYAVTALNNYEFPSGEVITVKPANALTNVANSLSEIVNSFKTSIDSNLDLLQLAGAIAQASTLLKAATESSEKVERDDRFCSVPLPLPKPKADPNAKVAQRCFLVFKPHPLSKSILEDIFCRFGNLIDVNTIPNKTFGFAKFATTASAGNAMSTLHNSTVHGIHMKVLEADEIRKDSKKIDDDEELEEIKRARLDK